MPKVEGAPKGLNEILESVYQDCMSKRKLGKERCSKIAWGAIKRVYRKNKQDNWVKRRG